MVLFHKDFSMTLTEYFKTDALGAKGEMSRYLGITPTWMSLLLSGRRKPSPALAIKLEVATGGLVTRQELRPDIFF
jgi:DNA-binding transcriptional regulator YdaS (Cro superfamily)